MHASTHARTHSHVHVHVLTLTRHEGKVEATVENRVTNLLEKFKEADERMKHGHKKKKETFKAMQKVLREHAVLSSNDSVFPFSETKTFGLDVNKMQDAFACLQHENNSS